MTTRRILATSGGMVTGPTRQSVRLGAMLNQALTLSEKLRPRICLVLTAGGESAENYAAYYEAFNVAGCDVSELKLFPQRSADPDERLCTSDLVWVGGGSLANLLSLWRLHSVDQAMRQAWESGVILAGNSAGSLCWFQGGTTDSFGPTLAPVTNGLGLLPYANGVHHDTEAQRRPLLHSLIVNGVLAPVGYATDDGVGIWFEGTEATRVVSDTIVCADEGPAAYRVALINGDVTETRCAVGTSFT